MHYSTCSTEDEIEMTDTLAQGHAAGKWWSQDAIRISQMPRHHPATAAVRVTLSIFTLAHV